jgi:2-polyprenyl-3-methyl-5-hydroxy-6-metoxy-1,4-benzoquinol methylase
MALMDKRQSLTDAEIREAMSRYKFYHIIPLTQTLSTPGNPAYNPAQELFMKHLKKLDLKGKRVLDVGCRDGLFSFAAESLGAAEVVGIDSDLSKPATEFLIPFFKSKVRMLQQNLYDLKAQELGFFDVILFPGVLYHLRYPFWGLKVLRDMMKPGGVLLTETAIWRGDPNNAMLFCPIEQDSPYEETSCTFFNEKGLVDTLKSLNFDTVEVEFVPDVLPGLRGRIARMNWAQIRGGLRNRIARMKWAQLTQILLAGGDPPKIGRVTRAVFHSTFGGHEKGSSIARYWEGTHQFHSEHGG